MHYFDFYSCILDNLFFIILFLNSVYLVGFNLVFVVGFLFCLVQFFLV